jgi:phosphoribosyl 1,2-cyclic phosphodiesterase
MPLYIASLNSGSNGNCYYIGNDKEAVLIDAGISCREKVKAIFISHEHTDHISGVAALSKKYSLPVYITAATLKHSRLIIEQDLITHFSANKPVIIGNLSVHAFTKHHDAADPHSFIVSGAGVNVGVFTDIGRCCDQLIHHFKQCKAAFLEANYDADYHLKKRISGGNGHLSNNEALQLFITHRPSAISHLILSHLSANNNNPKLVYGLFKPNAGSTEIIVASRHEETGVYTIGNTGVPVINLKKRAINQKPLQLMFDYARQ